MLLMYGKLALALTGLKGRRAHLVNQENVVFLDKKPNGKGRKRHLFRHDLCRLRNYHYKIAAPVRWYKLPFLSLF